MAQRKHPWIDSSDLLPMFPSLVWKMQARAEVKDAIAAKLLPELAALRRGQPPLAAGQGWQSEQALHQREALADLVACIRDAAGSVLRFLRIGWDAFEITGCWATVLAPGASHRMHTHPNNYLSGVYYLRTGPGADRINFHDPRSQAAIIRPPVTALTGQNTDQVVMEVTDGTLLLFPAWLPHSVDANESRGERVSVSFNIMFSGFTENLSKPLW